MLTRTAGKICDPTHPTHPRPQNQRSDGVDGVANPVDGVANPVDGVANPADGVANPVGGVDARWLRGVPPLPRSTQAVGKVTIKAFDAVAP